MSNPQLWCWASQIFVKLRTTFRSTISILVFTTLPLPSAPRAAFGKTGCSVVPRVDYLAWPCFSCGCECAWEICGGKERAGCIDADWRNGRRAGIGARNKTDKSGAVEREVLGRALELEEIGDWGGSKTASQVFDVLGCSWNWVSTGFERLSRTIFSTHNRITEANTMARWRTWSATVFHYLTHSPTWRTVFPIQNCEFQAPLSINNLITARRINIKIDICIFYGLGNQYIKSFFKRYIFNIRY